MKHWQELMAMEDVSINLEILTGMARVIANGAPESNMRDVENAMHNVADQLEALNQQLRNSFDVLFDAIKKEDSHEIKKGQSKTKRRSV